MVTLCLGEMTEHIDCNKIFHYETEGVVSSIDQEVPFRKKKCIDQEVGRTPSTVRQTLSISGRAVGPKKAKFLVTNTRTKKTRIWT